MANALLVIDVQNYFLKDAPNDLPQRIVGHQAALNYDHVVFTIFKNSPDSNFVSSLKWDKCNTDQDTLLPPDFDTLVTDHNVFKRAAYSAFKTTGLHEYLQALGTERLILCGVDSDACVLATAFEAFDLGYHVKINFDLTYSSNDLHGAAQRIAESNLVSRD